MRRDPRDDRLAPGASDVSSKPDDARLRVLALTSATAARDATGPLTYLLSNLEYLDSQLAQHERDLPAGRMAELRHCLTEATSAARHVREIVQVSLSPDAESGFEDQVDLQRLLLSCIKVARTEIDHRARVITEFEVIPQFLSSELRLRRLFLNLIINAAQAVAGDTDRENFIRVGTRKGSDGKIVVEVTDSGPGIPDETLPHLFEPFFTTRPMHEGAGLGLALCRQLLDEVGGDIEVESSNGRGATFRVTLPVSRNNGRTTTEDVRLTPSVPPVRRLPRRQLG